MIERAVAAEVALRRACKGNVRGVKTDHAFRSWIGKPAVAGAGTKDARLSDWAYCKLADLDGGEYGQTGLWTRGLLIRRSLSDGERASFTTWCPAGTPITTLVAVEGRRWSIEDAFETAKTELGFDHNETRSWHGWHRHASLVMMAYAVRAVIRHHASASSQKSPECRPGASDRLECERRVTHHEARHEALSRMLRRRVQQEAPRSASVMEALEIEPIRKSKEEVEPAVIS